MVQQAGELVFCDFTSILDHFSNSIFILSTSHAACSLPLGVVVVSDEKRDIIQCGYHPVWAEQAARNFQQRILWQRCT